jgi:hypothetical protein
VVGNEKDQGKEHYAKQVFHINLLDAGKHGKPIAPCDYCLMQTRCQQKSGVEAPHFLTLNQDMVV